MRITGQHRQQKNHNPHKRKPASKMVPVLMLLMVALVAADEPMTDLSVPVESEISSAASVIHCDSYTVCPDGTTCCLSPYGRWSCCPFSMGQCCRDGIHCCRHGYHCDSTSTHCLRGWLSMSSSPLPATKAIQKPQMELLFKPETVQCEGNVRCSADKFCCKTAAGQWGCCSGMEL